MVSVRYTEKKGKRGAEVTYKVRRAHTTTQVHNTHPDRGKVAHKTVYRANRYVGRKIRRTK